MPRINKPHDIDGVIWMKCKQCGEEYEILEDDFVLLDQPHYCPDCYFKLYPGKNRSKWKEYE